MSHQVILIGPVATLYSLITSVLRFAKRPVKQIAHSGRWAFHSKQLLRCFPCPIGNLYVMFSKIIVVHGALSSRSFVRSKISLVHGFFGRVKFAVNFGECFYNLFPSHFCVHGNTNNCAKQNRNCHFVVNKLQGFGHFITGSLFFFEFFACHGVSSWFSLARIVWKIVGCSPGRASSIGEKPLHMRKVMMASLISARICMRME